VNLANSSGQSCTSGGVGSLACGDFTGDGKNDFVFMRGSGIPSTSAIRFQLYVGNGNGTFQNPYTATTANLNNFKIGRGKNLETADINQDGKLDLLMGGNSGTNGGVRAWLNDGAASPKFSMGSLLVNNPGFSTEGVTGLAWGDFTGDSTPDLVITGAWEKKVYLYGGTGVGTVSATPVDITSSFPGGGTFVTTGDYSLDGKLDLAVGTDNFTYGSNIGGEVHYWKSDGDATPFSPGVTQKLVSHGTPYSDLDLGTSIQYDNDPYGTKDIIAADGNHAAGYLVLANRVLATYTQCGDVTSGVISLGSLSDTELVITTAKLAPQVATNGGSLTFYMSNEEPANWQLATACVGDPGKYCVSFPKPVGRTVRWKATMCSNASQTETPQIFGMDVEYDYTIAETHYRAGAVTQDDITYIGAFKQPGDRGHLYAVAAVASEDGYDGGISTTMWDAAHSLDSWKADSNRMIFTQLPDGSRIEVKTVNLNVPELITSLGAADQAQATTTINWLRSARFGANPPLSHLGAIETSTPAVVGAPPEPLWNDYVFGEDKAKVDNFRTAHANRQHLVLIGSKSGMLHAFRTNPDNPADPLNGDEAWAYLPRYVATGLTAAMTAGEMSSFVDGSPTVADVKLADGELHTIALVSGGNGGKSIFALDITSTVDLDDKALVPGPTPLWEIQPSGAFAGQAQSKPGIARVKIDDAERFIAVLATGIAYDNPDPPYTKGRDVIGVDLATGETIWQFRAACPITSDVILFETDDNAELGTPKIDGYTDRLTFADYCGNIYKVDPAQDLDGAFIDSHLLNGIDTGATGANSEHIYALFSTKYSDCGLGEERPIVGTLGARQDGTGQFALFFGTGGIESYTPTKVNAFFSIYMDTGEVRGCPELEPEKGRILGDCQGSGDNTVCEKFYGGVVVTNSQVIATRAIDPPVAEDSCSFGSSELVAFNLNQLDEQFVVATNSSTVSSLYGVGGALYFTTLSGAVVRVGVAAGTSGGDDGGGGDDDGGGGGDDDIDIDDELARTSPLTIGGWRQVE
jgi:hypothetical protein